MEPNPGRRKASRKVRASVLIPDDVTGPSSAEPVLATAAVSPQVEVGPAQELIVTPPVSPLPVRVEEFEIVTVHRPNASKGVWIAVAMLLALVVARPPLFLVAQALAYPFVLLLCCLALWKLYDFFRPVARKAAGGK